MEKVISSAKELKRLKSIVTLGMLEAVAVVLGLFTIQVGESLKIGISSVVNEMVGFVFGPVSGAVFSGIADLLKHFVKPTGAYFPGFTISAVLAGIIYGFMLYKERITFKRVLFTNFLVALFVNIILNTYWLTILYGDSYFVLLPARIVKNLIMFPIEATIFYSFSKSLSVISKRIFN